MWFKIEIKKTFSSKSALFEKSSFFHLDRVVVDFDFLNELSRKTRQ